MYIYIYVSKIKDIETTIAELKNNPSPGIKDQSSGGTTLIVGGLNGSSFEVASRWLQKLLSEANVEV